MNPFGQVEHGDYRQPPIGFSAVGGGHRPDLASRVLGQLSRAAPEKDLPACQDRHVAAGLADIFHDVGGEQHHPVGGQSHQQVAEADALLRVQPGGRLIHDQEARIVDKRLSDPHAPFHPAGEPLELTVSDLGQPHQVQHLGHPAAPLGRVSHPFQDRHVVHELARGQVGVEAELLRQVAEHGFDGDPAGLGGDVIAANLHLPAGWIDDARQDAHQRRLARAVGPQQAEHPRAQFQRDPIQSVDGLRAPAVGLG